MTRAWREDLIGQMFGRLTVIATAENQGSHRRWLCQCECGAQKEVIHGSLKRGLIRSCGCLRKEVTTIRMTSHGSAGRGKRTRAYGIWSGMLARCGIESATGFAQYGGVGVLVCERWHAFANFLADMGEPPAGMSIDRRNNELGYEPGNCRWATRQTQNENRRSVRVIEFAGLSMNVTQWAAHLGISKSTLLEALKKHPLEVAFRERGSR